MINQKKTLKKNEWNVQIAMIIILPVKVEQKIIVLTMMTRFIQIHDTHENETWNLV